MSKELTIFEGQELEILTKEDVSFDFDGKVLFNGKQSCKIMEYVNDRDAISKYVRENQRFKVKNSDVANHDFRKLNNAGETFITEKGIMKLIISSSMPKADEFEDKVWEIVTKVQQTGKFDSVEEKIKLIEDIKERQLTLTLYSLEQVIKVNPDDMLTAINYRQIKQELNQYKQDLKIAEQEKVIQQQQKQLEENTKRIDNIFVVGDRTQFNNEIKNVARASGNNVNDIYSLTYNKLKDLYSIDLYARSKNRKEEIQSERINNGGKAYSKETLNNKAGNLVIADELNLWNELGKSLNAVRDELLNKN